MAKQLYNKNAHLLLDKERQELRTGKVNNYLLANNQQYKHWYANLHTLAKLK